MIPLIEATTSIHLGPILEWLLVVFISFLVIKKIVDYLYMAAHPNYRWHQKENVCYDDRNLVSGIIASVGTILILCLYYDKLNIAW